MTTPYHSIYVAARRATTIAAKALNLSFLPSPPFCAAEVPVPPKVPTPFAVETTGAWVLKIVPVNAWPLTVVTTVAPTERMELPVVVAVAIDGKVAVGNNGPVVEQ